MASIHILHVDDDPDDAFFLFRAIKSAKPDCEVHTQTNGEQAIDYLRNASLETKTASHPIPDLMVLDLKLRGLSGFDVLSWTRDQTAFKTLPIIILSGSSLIEDKKKASGLGASDFIVKHSDFDQIAEQVIQFIPKINRSANLPSPSQPK